MIRKEMKLATFALVLGLTAAGARAAAVEMNLDAFHVDAPTTAYSNLVQSAATNNKAAGKLNKLVNKSPFVVGNDAVTTKGKAKGANFLTTSDALVDVEYSMNVAATGKKATGAVGMTFGYNTPSATGEDTSFFLLDWTADKKKKAGELSLSFIEGQVSGKGKKSELFTKQSSATATVTKLGSLAGGFKAGLTNNIAVTHTATGIVVSLNGQIVIEVNAGDLGLDGFEAGAFGLYNAGARGASFFDLQANLLAGQNPGDYGSLSPQEIEDHAGTINAVVETPTPSAAVAGLALMGLTVARRRRHAA